MKTIFGMLSLVLFVQACKEKVEMSSINPVNWDKRTINYELSDSLTNGTTYLSVYSQIYSQTEHKTRNLTAIVSIRNTNKTDTVFIKKAEYFNTKGKRIRTYFDGTILIAPMETVEIVIDEEDREGGTGANFLFNWATKPNSNAPFFEGVMVLTSGTQGLSFTTQGKRVD